MNIRKVLKKLKVDLYTHVIDNKEADDIIRSFFKASVPDLDCATDIALASLDAAAALRRELGDETGVADLLQRRATLAAASTTMPSPPSPDEALR